MADYARQGEQAKWARGVSASSRRQRTARPLNDNVPVLNWLMEGDVTFARTLLPVKVTINEDSPEWKEIIAFDGWLQSGSVTLTWQSLRTGVILNAAHVITAGDDNFVALSPGFLIESGIENGDRIQPFFLDIADGTEHLTCEAYVRTVPV